jgi:hypothetical protein
VPIQGRNGKTREQHWQEYGHKATFKSIAMHGFPNFFYILGPNSGRLYTSTIQIIERCVCHSFFKVLSPRDTMLMIISEVELVLKAIQPILHHQAASVDVRADKEREYDVQLHEAIDKTVHSSLCGSVCDDVPPTRPCN